MGFALASCADLWPANRLDYATQKGKGDGRAEQMVEVWGEYEVDGREQRLFVGKLNERSLYRLARSKFVVENLIKSNEI